MKSALKGGQTPKLDLPCWNWVTTAACAIHKAKKYCDKCLLLEEDYIGNYFSTLLGDNEKTCGVLKCRCLKL